METTLSQVTQRPLVQLFSLLSFDAGASQAAREELGMRADDIRAFISGKGTGGAQRTPFDLPGDIAKVGAPLVPVLVEWLSRPGQEAGCALGMFKSIELLSSIAEQAPSAVKAQAKPLREFLDRFVRQDYMKVYSVVYQSPGQAEAIGKLVGQLIDDRVGFVQKRINLLLEGNSHSSKGSPHPGQLGQAAALLAVIADDRTPECAALLKDILTRASNHSPLIPYAFPQYVRHGGADWVHFISKNSSGNLKSFPSTVLRGLEIAASEPEIMGALNPRQQAAVATSLADAALYEPNGGNHRIRALEALGKINPDISKAVRMEILAEPYKNNPCEVEYVFMTYREVQPYCLYTLLKDAKPAEYHPIVRAALSRGWESSTAAACFSLLAGGKQTLETPINVLDPVTRKWGPFLVEAPAVRLDQEPGANGGAVAKIAAEIGDCLKRKPSEPHNEIVRHNAIAALLNLKATETLQSLARSEYPILFADVLTLSGRVFPELAQEYKRGLKSGNQTIRAAAVAGLCKNGTDAAFSFLEQWGGRAMIESFSTNAFQGPIIELAKSNRQGALRLLRAAIEKGGLEAKDEQHHQLQTIAGLHTWLSKESQALAG